MPRGVGGSRGGDTFAWVPTRVGNEDWKQFDQVEKDHSRQEQGSRQKKRLSSTERVHTRVGF